MASPHLAGIRVLDMAEVWAGPMGTSMLADMGAEVIKIESFPRAPQTRPPTRPKSPPFGYAGGPEDPNPWDRLGTHNMANREKYGIAIDAVTPEGRDTVRHLAALSDVLVDGYSAGTMERLGLGYDTLCALNPGLIMISMPGWGSDGPYRGWVTLGSGIDAMSGHHYLRGYPDADPSQTPASVHSDAVAAPTLAFAVMTALFQRRTTGQGQWIDFSQAEAFLPHLAYPLLDYAMNGRVAQPLGNHDRSAAPHNSYPSLGTDQWLAIAVETDEQWQALCSVAGHPEWAADRRFITGDARYQHQDELDSLVSGWTHSAEKRELAVRLQAAGVPAGPVLDEIETINDPHMQARGFFQPLHHSTIGSHRYAGTLWRFVERPMRITRAPNALGEHNEAILRDLLGMNAVEYVDAVTAGWAGNSYSAASGL